METQLPKSGPERFERWKSTLFVDPSASNVESKLNYFRMRESLADKFAKVSRVSPGCDGEIMRDVIRTFQKQRFFQRGQPGQRMLLHILFGLAAARPDVGYCQGMNYVVASLLLGRIPEQYTDIDHCTPLTAENEEVTSETPEEESTPDPDPDPDHSSGTSGFEVAASVVRAVVLDNSNMSESQMDEAEVDVFLFMMELLSPQSKLDMAGMWKERIPKLKLRIYQLDRLLRWSYPQLHAHFTSIELSPEVITAQWFLTLFTYTFPVVPTVLQLWDYIFLTGWEGLFKVALSVLGSLQTRLLELEDFESIVMLMREWKREGTMIITESMEALLSRASKFVVNKEVLDKLQESFASEILTIALIRAQFLNDERNNNIGVSSAGVSSIYGSSAYSAIATITGSGKDRSNSTSPVPYTSTPVNNSSDVLAQLPSSSSTTSLSASYNTNYSMDNAAKSGKGDSNSVRTDDSVVSYSAESSAKQQSSSGLQSLSQTERRKEMQRIQDRELAIEAQIMSGAEAPVFWLLRYGSKLPEKTLQELRKIKLDLLALDDQVDVDKQQIQAKIIKACEMNRETQDELSAAEAAMHEASATVEQGKVSLQSALMLARQIALEVVELMEGTNNTGPTATVTGEGSSNNNSESGSIIEHGSIPAFGSYGGGTSVTNTSLFSSGMGHNHHNSNSSNGGEAPSMSSSPGGIRFPSMLAGPWAKRHTNNNSSNKSNHNSDKQSKAGSEKFTSLHSYSATTTAPSVRVDSSIDTTEASIYSDTLSVRSVGTDYTHEASTNNPSSLFLTGEESDYDDFDSAGIADSLSGLKLGAEDYADSLDNNNTSPYSNNSSAPNSARNSNSSSPARPSNTDTNNTSASSHPNHTTNYHHSYSSSNSNVGIAQTSESSTGSGGGHHGKKNSGGLLSSLSLSTSRLHWNFPVVRAVHHAAGIPCERLNIGTNKGNEREVSAKLTTKQMKQLERRGQWAQQQIIDIDRALEESKRGLEFARKRLEQAKISNDETVTWKNSLCDQLHLLVRDSNRGRSQKLMFVAENYNI